MNIVLTGFMGTGKSSVGRKLAERLGLKYADTDDLVEARCGMAISEIFEKKGEAYFRTIEREVVRDVTSEKDGFVLSTGGGAVADEENRKLFRAWGTIVCLRASVEAILKRVASGDERPLLQGPDKRASIEELLKGREAVYRDCDLSIDTTKKAAGEVTDEIERFLLSKRR